MTERGMTESDEADKVLQQIKQNVLMVSQGKTYPQFQNLPDLLPDPTNPLTQTAESQALLISNQPAALHSNQPATAVIRYPSSSVPPPPRKVQSNADLHKMLSREAERYGVMVEKAHLEDIYTIASVQTLTDRDMHMYIRGVLRTTQISLTNALSKVITSVENILTRNQQIMSTMTDSNKQIIEKLSIMSDKLDNIAPTFNSMVQSEHNIIRAMIAQGQTSPSGYAAPLAIVPASASGKEPTVPGKEEIMLICKAADCPVEYAEGLAAKYEGKVSWEEYL